MMDLNKRAMVILKYMIQSSKLVSGTELAIASGTTSKTVNTEIRNISKILRHFGAEIVPHKGIGYELKISDKNEFDVFVQCFVDKILNETEWFYYPKERIDDIIYHLCFEEHYLKASEIAERLYISQSTLAADLKKIRTILKKFHLELIHRPSYGMKIEGREIHLRMLMGRYMFIDEEENFMEFNEPYFNLDSSRVQRCIENLFIQFHIHMSLNSIDEIVRYIIISAWRINGRHFSEHIDFEKVEISETLDYELSCRLWKILEIEAGEEEKEALAYLIMSRRNFVSEKEICGAILKESAAVYKKAAGGLGKIKNLKSDIDTKRNFLLVFSSMLIRYKLGVEYYRYTKGIKASDPAIDDDVSDICCLLNKICCIKLNEADRSLLYDVFENCIGQYYSSHSHLRICYTSANGLAAAKYYANHLRKWYDIGENDEIFREIYELDMLENERYLIVTDMPKQKFSNIEQRIIQLTEGRGSLNSEKIRSILFYEKLGKPLETIFPEKLFMISDKNNLNEVIVQMVQAICIRKELSNDLCRQMLYKADACPAKAANSTVILTGKWKYPENTAGAAVVLKKPILFENMYVQIIFIVVKGQDNYWDILRLLSCMADDFKKMQQLIQNPDYELLKSLFHECSGLI